MNPRSGTDGSFAGNGAPGLTYRTGNGGSQTVANHRLTSGTSVSAEHARAELQVPGVQTPSFKGETSDISASAFQFSASVGDIHDYAGFPLL